MGYYTTLNDGGVETGTRFETCHHDGTTSKVEPRLGTLGSDPGLVELLAKDVVEESLRITAGICIYTNDRIHVGELS